MPSPSSPLPPDFDALDALIDEALGGPSPPDQTEQILRRFTVPVIDTSVRPKRRPPKRRRPRWAIGLAAAAGLLVAFAIGWSTRRPDADAVAVTPSDAPPEASPPITPVQPPRNDPGPPVAPVQLALDPTPELLDEPSQLPASPPGAPSSDGPVRLRLTPPRAAEAAEAYYAAVGVTPTPLLSDKDLAERLTRQWGVEFTAADVSSLTNLRLRLADPAVVDTLVDRWQNANETWVAETRREELVEILSTTNPASETFFARSLVDVDRYSMHATAWAGLAAGRDVRCARCHDRAFADVDRVEHWALIAKLSETDEPLFFQDQRSRQVLADPAIAPDVDRATVAGGWVDSMWRTVHDRPLVAGFADPGPADLPTDAIRQSLIDDLLADATDAGFDLSRLLAQIVRHPITRRQAAEAGSRWLPADERDRAERMVAAYAAAAAPRPPRWKRVELVRSGIGGLDVTTLGQIRSVEGGKPDAASASHAAVDGGLDPASTMPIERDPPAAAWWSRIDDPAVLRDHLAYLRHRDRLEDRWIELDEAMAAAGIDPMTRVNRLWWAMK